MTSVHCTGGTLQQTCVCVLTVGFLILLIAGCTPSALDGPAQGYAAPEEVTAELPPDDTLPAEESPAEEPPVEETPVYDAAIVEEDPPSVDAPKEQPAAEAAAADDEFDPTAVVTVKWLPEPIEVADADAETEAEMKPYTDVIPGSDVTFDMLPIAGGKFTMGSPAGEKKRQDSEGPQHEVEIEPFWMGKFEVTWDEYELWGMALDIDRRNALGRKTTERDKLCDAIARPTKPYSDMTFGMGKDGFPAICMTQLAARCYCKWLSAKTGRFYRLPTEAEWEYACRAGTTTAYSFGDNPKDLNDYGWYYDEDSDDDRYHRVGKKKPNPWGLYDMHGNVSEWVLDQFIPDYYAQFDGKTAKRPLAVPTTLFSRVARGGCWDDDPDKLRSAARVASHKDWKQEDPQIPKSIWYLTEIFCPGIRVVRPLRVPGEEEAQLYEPDIEEIREYSEAQAGKE